METTIKKLSLSPSWIIAALNDKTSSTLVTDKQKNHLSVLTLHKDQMVKSELPQENKIKQITSKKMKQIMINFLLI
jgi:hypothetical protein